MGYFLDETFPPTASLKPAREKARRKGNHYSLQARKPAGQRAVWKPVREWIVYAPFPSTADSAQMISTPACSLGITHMDIPVMEFQHYVYFGSEEPYWGGGAFISCCFLQKYIVTEIISLCFTFKAEQPTVVGLYGMLVR